MPQAVVSIGRHCVASGRRWDKVSGNRSATHSSVSAPHRATAIKLPRQPHQKADRPPNKGQSRAMTPRPVSAQAITCAPAVGSKRSRNTARAQTTAAAMAAPCKPRHTTNASMLPAAAQPTLAIVYRAKPASRTGRRPKRSETGPHTNWAKPKLRIKTDMVSCAHTMLPPRSRDSMGSDGR